MTDQVSLEPTMARQDPVLEPASSDRTLTLSAERLTVGTQRAVARTVRLERYQVTETRTVTVDVLCDRVRMITLVDGEPPQIDEIPTSIGDRSDHVVDGSRWLILTEEQVRIVKTVVPVERVRLDVSTVVTEQVVTAGVRAERAEIESPDRSGEAATRSS